MHAICTTSCRAPSVLTYIICVGATPPPLPRHCVGVCHHQHRHPARAPLLPALSCSCKSKRLVCELPYNPTHTVLLRAHAARADSFTCRPEGLLAPKTTYVALTRQQLTLLTGPMGGVLSHRGRARRRVVVFSARKYILSTAVLSTFDSSFYSCSIHTHTRPTVAWGPPPGAYRACAGSRTKNV